MSAVSTLGLEPQVFGTGTGSDDNGIGLILLRIFHYHFFRRYRKIHFGDDSRDKLSTESLCLPTQVVHHLERLDSIGITRKIFDLCSSSQLSSQLRALYKDRLKISTRGIDSRCISGRAGADDKTFNFIHRIDVYRKSIMVAPLRFIVK